MEPPAPATVPPLVESASANPPAAVNNPTNLAVTTTNLTGAPPAAAKNNSANWEEEIAAIMDGEEADTNKAAALFGLFHKLPVAGQVEAAQDLGDLVTDENFAPLGALLKDDKLSPEVLDALMADALGRPNAIKLPLLLDVARDAANPKATDAKDVLEVFTGEDYGDDWTKWQQKIAAWMQENPD
jgi:hypothetical protein